jgi:hypothetical protein
MESEYVRASSKFILFAALSAFVPVLASSAIAGAQVHAAAREYSLTIRGIDRAGKKVAIEPVVFGATNGKDYLTYLSSVSVPAGNYVVAAAISDPGQNDGTLVAALVRVRSGRTVTLSAVKSVAVKATLSGLGTGVMQANQQAMLCVRAGRSYVPVAGLLVVPTLVNGDAAPGTVYVKPMTGKGLRFVYQTYWGGPSPLYEEAGAYQNGMPSKPAYSQTVAGLANVAMQLRANQNSTALRNVFTHYDGCGSLALPEESLPAAYTDYRTPGSWQTQLNFGASKGDITRELVQSGSYLGGHAYTDALGGAVAGPGADYPVIDGTSVAFAPHEIFGDPLATLSTDCEGQGRVTLARSSSTVRSRKVGFCGKTARFSAAPPRAGWYTLTASFARTHQHGNLLSTGVSLSWHFKYAPVRGHAVNIETAPVTVTEFRPAGLGMSDDTQGAATTTIKVLVLRGGGGPVHTPRYRLTSVRVEVSVNNGHSWQSLALTAGPGYWLASVANPAAPGFVDLRSIVTDAHGDKTVETVTRAYLVDAG